MEKVSSWGIKLYVDALKKYDAVEQSIRKQLAARENDEVMPEGADDKFWKWQMCYNGYNGFLTDQRGEVHGNHTVSPIPSKDKLFSLDAVKWPNKLKASLKKLQKDLNIPDEE